MSIRQILIAAESDGRLVALQPRRTRAARLRSMYLTSDLIQEIEMSVTDSKSEMRAAELEATLALFVISRTIDPDYVKLLRPTDDTVWEIRAVLPDPSIRVFGFFAYRDAFVATNLELRSTLGEFESESWRLQKMRAKARWRRIFDPWEPRSETDGKQLITGALDGKWFEG